MRAVSGTRVLHSFTKYLCLKPVHVEYCRAKMLEPFLCEPLYWPCSARRSVRWISWPCENVAVPSDRFLLNRESNHLTLGCQYCKLCMLKRSMLWGVFKLTPYQHILMSWLRNIDSIPLGPPAWRHARKNQYIVYSLVYTCMSLSIYVPLKSCTCTHVSIGTCTAQSPAWHTFQGWPATMALQLYLDWILALPGEPISDVDETWSIRVQMRVHLMPLRRCILWIFAFLGIDWVFSFDSFSFWHEHPSKTKFECKEFEFKVATRVETSSTAHALHSKVRPCQTNIRKTGQSSWYNK